MHAAVQRRRLRDERLHRRTLGAVPEDEDVRPELGLDPRAGFQEPQRVLLRPQMADEADQRRPARDPEALAQLRAAVAGLEALGADPVRDVAHEALGQAPALPRDPLEVPRRHDERVDSRQDHPARERPPALLLHGLVGVEAVLVMHDPVREAAALREHGVERAPVVGEHEVGALAREQRAQAQRRRQRSRARRRVEDAHVRTGRELRARVRPPVDREDRVPELSPERLDEPHRAHLRPRRDERREDVEEVRDGGHALPG
jgi:hypothetical protein